MISQQQKSQPRTNMTKKQSDSPLRDSKSAEYNLAFEIFCVGAGMLLRPEARKKIYTDDPLRIMGANEGIPNAKNLWLFNQIKDRKGEIINFITDLAIEYSSESREVTLSKSYGKPSQLFQFEKEGGEEFNGSDKLFRIKDSNNMYLSLDGILEAEKLDKSEKSDKNQLFEIRQRSRKQLKAYPQLVDSYQIRNLRSLKYLDVAEASVEIGARVILYAHNGRSNQTWILDPPLNLKDKQLCYSIRSYLTNRRLDLTPDGRLIQTENEDRIWQLKEKVSYEDKHLINIYCTRNGKYLCDFGENESAFKSEADAMWEFQ